MVNLSRRAALAAMAGAAVAPAVVAQARPTETMACIDTETPGGITVLLERAEVQPLTVIGVRNDGGATVHLHTSRGHYSTAVDDLIQEVAPEFYEETFDHEEEDADPADNADQWLASDRAAESFTSIRVYQGHIPEGADLSQHTLVHEE